MELLETIQEAAEESLPIPTPKPKQNVKTKSMPGWEDVKPFRDESYFWHQIWQSYGRPLNCYVHNMMKTTRNQYHYQLKKCRKAEDKIRKNKLLNSCLNGGKDLFNEIKRKRKSNTTVAASMDGVTTKIEEHFGNKYKNLYNSTDDEDELKRVQINAEDRVTIKFIG